MYRYEKTSDASVIVWSVSVSAVVWSSVLISVTWVELPWAVYKFFRINNIELKCSFVRCRKYPKSWWNGAPELHISVDLLCGTRAAELHNFWHNGRRATQLGRSTLWHNGCRNFWKMNVLKDSANSWNVYALGRSSKLLKDERFTKTEQKTTENGRGRTNHHVS